jgi:hypothetical protein
MSGHAPQAADGRRANDKMPAKVRELSHSYSKELLGVVDWCLKLDVLERPQSVFALQKALLDRVPTVQKQTLGGRALGALRSLKPRGLGLGDSGRASTISMYTRQSN